MRGFLSCGLAALTPGPTEALNFGRLGVGGVKDVAGVPFLRPFGLGVGGYEVVGAPRRAVLVRGTKMPAPGAIVAKYEILWNMDQHPSTGRSGKGRGGSAGLYAPIHIAAVLAPGRKIRVQLYPSKGSLFPLDTANKAHNAVHTARHVDRVADGEVFGREPSRALRDHAARCVA